ncbi:hypothetical protein [Levilactobacillus bambusae]|uniref:Uncharacterized protein n=1 Tax=Levilactobacillus bambusae TaxID=2024736 RepID=A0A2V1N155_9LACO|nr:hypothetical protein [Levilactobacillus bambusae]PWG00753.1 hypothetical protein DCM90_00830 [Levilactobacillus bambusae]
MKQEIINRIGWPYWLVGVGLGIVVPWVLVTAGMAPWLIFCLLLSIVNTMTSIIIGRVIQRRNGSWAWMLIWPLCFAIGAELFLKPYMIVFAIVYLCLSYMSYGLSATA